MHGIWELHALRGFGHMLQLKSYKCCLAAVYEEQSEKMFQLASVYLLRFKKTTSRNISLDV